MSVTTTSLDAYNNIVKPNLAKTESAILDILRHLKEATNLEINDYSGIPINIVAGRMNGLVKKGLVVESQKRDCTISGHKVIAWRVIE